MSGDAINSILGEETEQQKPTPNRKLQIANALTILSLSTIPAASQQNQPYINKQINPVSSSMSHQPSSNAKPSISRLTWDGLHETQDQTTQTTQSETETQAEGNPYQKAVQDAIQKEEAKITDYGVTLKFEFEKTNSGLSADYSGIPVYNPYDKFLLSNSLANTLSKYPKDLIKNLGLTFFASGNYDIQEVTGNAGGSYNPIKKSIQIEDGDTTTIHHELAHAILWNKTDEYIKLIKELYKKYDCEPYYEFQMESGQPTAGSINGDFANSKDNKPKRTECAADSFAEEYGMKNPVEDIATIAAALFNPDTQAKLLADSSLDTTDSKILKAKIEFIIEAYAKISNGAIDKTYWENIVSKSTEFTESAETTESTEAPQIDKKYTQLYNITDIDQHYIQTLFPKLELTSDWAELPYYRQLQQFKELIWQDINSKLPPETVKLLDYMYKRGDDSNEISNLTTLLEILALPLDRLKGDFANGIIDKIDKRSIFLTSINLKEILALDDEFFELAKNSILKNTERNSMLSAPFYDQLIAFTLFSHFYEFAEHFSGDTKAEFFEKIMDPKVANLYEYQDQQKLAARINDYGLWIYLISTDFHIPVDSLGFFTDPNTFLRLSEILNKQDQPGYPIMKSFNKLMQLYSKIRSVNPNLTDQEFIDLTGRSLNFESLNSLDFLLSVTQESYQPSEWFSKFQEISKASTSILNVIERTKWSLDEIIYTDQGKEILTNMINNTAYRDFVKDILMTIAKTDSYKTMMSATTIDKLAKTTLSVPTQDADQFKQNILGIIDSEMDYAKDNIVKLIANLANEYKDPDNFKALIELTGNALKSENLTTRLSIIGLELKYRQDDRYGELINILRQNNYIEPPIADNIQVILSKIDQLPKTQANDLLISEFKDSVSRISSSEDSSNLLVSILTSVYNSFEYEDNIQPAESINRFKAFVNVARILSRNGLNPEDVQLDNIISQNSLENDWSGVLYLDVETTGPSDVIFELEIVQELGPFLDTGELLRADVFSIRNTYQEYKEANVYPPLVLENIFRKIFDLANPLEIIRANTALYNALKESDPYEKAVFIKTYIETVNRFPSDIPYQPEITNSTNELLVELLGINPDAQVLKNKIAEVIDYTSQIRDSGYHSEETFMPSPQIYEGITQEFLNKLTKSQLEVLGYMILDFADVKFMNPVIGFNLSEEILSTFFELQDRQIIVPIDSEDLVDQVFANMDPWILDRSQLYQMANLIFEQDKP